ncbi:MAG: hypothetical protein COB22_07490 [Cycloclasticus sp.]|nr:MAG: hypothetical protein COB22_07490 [Cycloclasticus sp.]
MFKALLLKNWYKLSNPALEKQLARDLLFRRFTGLDISESAPEHSTFWRLRQTLEKLCLMDGLLNEINRQLSDQGLTIKSGEVSSIDKVNGVAREGALGRASVIEAKNCRPNKNKQGESTQDPEASWNVKMGSDGKRKSTYGYKAHVNVDEIVLLNQAVTPLACPRAPSLAVPHQFTLSSMTLTTLRAYRNKPRNKKTKHFSRTHCGVRCTVERVFGVLKQHYGMAKARYRGLDRNRTRFEQSTKKS